MSSITGQGRNSRKIMTIMAAVAAVAMLIAVPILSATDADAAFTNDDAGYKVVITDAAKLEKMGLNKTEVLFKALESEISIFNEEIYGEPVTTVNLSKYTTAVGAKVEGDTVSNINTDIVDAKDVKITMTAIAAGSLISGDQTLWTDQQKAAAKAISDFIGSDLGIGDKVEITGTVKTESASQTEVKWKLLDGNKCVRDKFTTTYYIDGDVDLNIKVTMGGTSKEIQIVSNVKGVFASKSSFEYKDSDVKVGTEYKVTYDIETTYSGDSYYNVDGKKYSLVTEEKTPDPVTGTVEDHDIYEQSVVSNIDYYKKLVNDLPPAEDGMEIDKTYGGAQSAFDGVVMDAVGKDILKIVLIVGAVILGIIVLIVILIIVLIVRKKKRQ